MPLDPNATTQASSVENPDAFNHTRNSAKVEGSGSFNSHDLNQEEALLSSGKFYGCAPLSKSAENQGQRRRRPGTQHSSNMKSGGFQWKHTFKTEPEVIPELMRQYHRQLMRKFVTVLKESTLNSTVASSNQKSEKRGSFYRTKERNRSINITAGSQAMTNSSIRRGLQFSTPINNNMRLK